MEISVESKKSAAQGLRCNTCNVYVPNEASLAAHLKGKKHIKNIEKRKNWETEAERSLYITGLDHLAAAELSLADYFLKYGAISKITVDKNNGRFAILEFTEPDSAKQALQEKQHFLETKLITVKPREVRLPAAKKPATDQHHIVHGQMHPDVWKALMDVENTEVQFQTLQRKLSLTSDDLHLRDLICQLLHSAFEEVFIQCQIQPFGSSVNGFGIHGCDLDLNFHYEGVDYDAAIEFLNEEMEDTLDQNKNKTFNVKQVLTIIAGIIRQCVPDCHQVKAVLSARRPVVKFYHKSSQMCCDISIGNMLAVRNTMFLKDLSDNFSYLASLVQAVRLWMTHWKLGGSTQAASPLLNNYAVTLLVLFYLYEKNHILTVDEMRASDNNLEPCRIENWDCSFQSVSLLENKVNSGSLSDLFAEFFHFYSKFDFANQVLCLKTGKTESISKCEEKNNPGDIKLKGVASRAFKFGALNIRDPFELNHNVAGNVGHKHVLILTKCIRNAALACDMKLYSKKPGDQSNKEPWGILNLFVDHHTKRTAGPSPKNSFIEKSDLTIEISNKVDNGENTQKKLIPVILTIFENVFFIRINPDEDIGADINEHSESTSVNLQKFSKVPNSENEDCVSETRKRRHDESPMCQKRAKVAVISSPEALNIKNKAAEFTFEENITFPFMIECEALYRVWEGRRKVRRHLVQPGMGDILDLEKQVSRLLLSEAQAQESEAPDADTSTSSLKDSIKTYFKFALTITEVNDVSLALNFRFLSTDQKTDRNIEQDFQNFFHHLKTFLPNIVTKCLKVK